PGDAIAARAKADRLGPGRDPHAEGLRVAREPLDEAVRHEEGVLPAVEGADDAGAQRGLGRPRRRAVEDLDGRAGLAEEASLLVPVRQFLAREEHGQGARLTKGEVEAALLRELLVELQALDAQAPEQCHRVPEPRRGAGGAELPEPPRELETRARLDVEGAVPIQHPLDALPPDPGGGEGEQVARDDEPGVPVRAARADLALLEERDVPSIAGEVVGGGDADHATADDHDAACAHLRPPQRSRPGAGGAGSIAGRVTGRRRPAGARSVEAL